MGKSTISMAIFHCYVSSPEGKLSPHGISMFRPIQVPWLRPWRKAPAGGPPSPGWAPAGEQFLQKIDWRNHGTSVEHPWNIYGKSMENLWENLWNIYGKSMGKCEILVRFREAYISWFFGIYLGYPGMHQQVWMAKRLKPYGPFTIW